jgi:tRNA(Arg) A34 adenosine deaminase TadA
MTPAQMLAHLRSADAVAREAAAHGHHPFGAVLVGPDDRVLMRQGNLDTVRHAETELCRRAAAAYSADFLWGCTLVTTGEPCAMCAGTMYWANVGRLVYGFEEEALLALTGAHKENPTMSLSCRAVLGSGQKPIEIHGPFPEIADELIEPHRTFWQQR